MQCVCCESECNNLFFLPFYEINLWFIYVLIEEIRCGVCVGFKLVFIEVSLTSMGISERFRISSTMILVEKGLVVLHFQLINSF